MTREESIAYIKAIKNGLHETGKDFPYRDEIIPVAKEALEMAIKALSSSENPNKWIPCSERLPEIHQDVILSLRNLDIEVGFRAETEPDFYCHGYYIEPKSVLAWMPLPEPYKSEIPTVAEGSEE